jgi:hypothetical protein
MMSKSKNILDLNKALVHSETKKVFKIPRLIESYGKCMKH